MRVPAAGETDIAAFAPAPPRLFAADVTNLISARVADTPSTPCGYPAVSVKHSKQEAGKSFGAKSLRCTTLHSRDGRNRQRNTDHGCRPAYMQPSHEAGPKHRHPNGHHPDAPSPTQTGPYATSQAAAHVITNPLIASKTQQLGRRTLNRWPTTPRHLVTSSPLTQRGPSGHHAKRPTCCPTANPDGPSPTPCEPHTTPQTTPNPRRHI
jgi:hypothetical protein